MQTKLSCIAKSFPQLKLGLDLQQAANKGNTLIHLSIQKAFNNKTPLEELISTVKSQASDNPESMVKVLGQDLTQRVLNFKQA